MIDDTKFTPNDFVPCSDELNPKQIDDLIITKTEQKHGLEEKLFKLGFNTSDYKTKNLTRFFVKIAGLPPHLIKSVSRPNFKTSPLFKSQTPDGHTVVTPAKDHWYGNIELEVYNSVKDDVEQKVIELIKQGDVRIKILILSDEAEITTTWDIQANNGIAYFKPLDWETDKPDIINVSFVVKSATIEYSK
jgi:hypothetical protein